VTFFVLTLETPPWKTVETPFFHHKGTVKKTLFFTVETTFSVTVQTPLKNLFLFTLKPLWKHLFFTTKTAFFVTVQTPLKHFFVTLKPLWRHIFFVEIIFFPTVQPPLKHFFSHSVLKHFGNTSFSHR